MSNQPVEIIPSQEEQKISDVPVSQQADNKTQAKDLKEKRKLYKKNSPRRKMQRIIQELNQEWKKTLKISVTDPFTIQCFKRRITDEKLEQFLSSLKKKLEENNIPLTYLDLNLKNCRLLTPKTYEILISHFGTTFKNLEYLKLALPFDFRTEEATTDLIKHIGLKLTNLQHLILDLPYNHTTNRLETITQYLLPNLPRLKTFRFTNAANYCTKEKQIVDYVKAIAHHLPLLEDFELELTWCCMLSDGSFNEIVKEICENLQNLKHFSLKAAHYSELSENSLINLFRNMGPGLKNLESLEVNLKNRKKNQMTDHVLESLANRFNDNFHGLKNLTLNFEGASKFTNEGVVRLMKSIGNNLKNLKNLNLNLNGLWNIDDETIESCAFLNNENLPELESLKLSIAGAKITNQGLKKFIGSFEGKSDNLKELTIDLSGCKSLTESGIKHLGTHIPQAFKNVKKLQLVLRNHKQTLTPKMKAQLSKALKSIPKVDIIVG